MLQIRLSKGGSAADGGGSSSAKPSLPAETVTVACPDHLVLADLPVAKSLGAVTASSASSAVKSTGRRSRRHLGERVHFCVCCDYPIAIYGRLIPCEHAFCFTCARSDSSCYLCDERIQKIQTIKMMEGIFICAAPHCLKSFLKRSEFETHIHESHADLLQSNMERDGGNETDGLNIPRPPSMDTLLRQSAPLETSSARGHTRAGFSPNSSSQPQDREEKARRNPSREQTPLKPPPQPKQLSFHGHQPHQAGDTQPDVNAPPHGLERPYKWFHHSHGFENQSGTLHRQDSDQLLSDKNVGLAPESSIPNYPSMPTHQLAAYQVPLIANHGLNPPPLFSYPPFPADGSQRYLGTPYEMPRPEMVPEGAAQVSLLGFPPAPAGATTFPDGFRSWGAGIMGVPSEPLSTGQGIPESYMNATDSQGRVPFFQGECGRFPDGPVLNPPPGKEADLLQGSSADHGDGKGPFALRPPHMSLSHPPPPPPQYKWGKASGEGGQDGQGYGWQMDKRVYGNGPD